jgi:hypothetical protein
MLPQYQAIAQPHLEQSLNKDYSHPQGLFEANFCPFLSDRSKIDNTTYMPLSLFFPTLSRGVTA